MTTEHQEALDKVSKALFLYVDNIFIIKSIYDTIGNAHVHGIASPYLNFRDALFHYKKMYDAASNNDNVGVIRQNACLEEHLNRGIRDFAVNLCTNYFIPVIHLLMNNKSKPVDDQIFLRLRHVYHELKGIVAEIRLGGQQLMSFDNNAYWLPKIITVITDFNAPLGEKPLLKRLYDRVNKSI